MAIHCDLVLALRLDVGLHNLLAAGYPLEQTIHHPALVVQCLLIQPLLLPPSIHAGGRHLVQCL